jgi:hypothetical protein
MQISYVEPMKFADGVDSISERIRGKAVTYQKHSPPLYDATGMDIEAYNVVCKSQKELEDTFEVSAAMSFRFGLGSLGGNFQFVNKHVMTDTSLCFVVKVQVGKLASSIDDVELSRTALAQYKKDPIKFLKTYGDYYISGLKTGGAFYGTIFVECKEDSRKKEIDAELKGKAQLVLLDIKGRGEIKKGLIDIIQNLDKRVYVHTTGFTFPELPLTDDVEKMLELASIFANKMEEKGKLSIIKAILKDYETLGLSDNDDELVRLKEEREMLIEKCAILRSEILSKLETINQIRGHPKVYPKQNSEKLSQYQAELTSLLSTINKRASQCLTNPRCHTNVDDLKLPEMKELDEIKELSKTVPPTQTVDSQISAKYELFKDIMGNPKNGEQTCSDREGKYRLYENGVIFWHPQIGSYEVHGPIFERYEKESMERGRFGYPTSDEEYVQPGYRRNTFQKGGIFFIPSRNEILVGIGNKPTGYKYEFTSAKFISKGRKHPKAAHTFLVARDLNVKRTKVEYTYLPATPTIIDLSLPISSKKKSFTSISRTMTFRK